MGRSSVRCCILCSYTKEMHGRQHCFLGDRFGAPIGDGRRRGEWVYLTRARAGGIHVGVGGMIYRSRAPECVGE